MSILSNSIGQVLTSAASLSGESITYDQDGEVVAITGAVRGSTNQEAESKFPGSRIADRSVDWIIEASQLKTAGDVTIVPARGDTITDGAGKVYRVMPFSSGSDLWKWVDREGKTRRRIFTKERN